jgi:hypothetical protein
MIPETIPAVVIAPPSAPMTSMPPAAPPKTIHPPAMIPLNIRIPAAQPNPIENGLYPRSFHKAVITAAVPAMWSKTVVAQCKITPKMPIGLKNILYAIAEHPDATIGTAVPRPMILVRFSRGAVIEAPAVRVPDRVAPIKELAPKKKTAEFVYFRKL